MILKYKNLKMKELSYWNEAEYWKGVVEPYGGHLCQFLDWWYITIPDTEAWHVPRAHWKPINCNHADYKLVDVCSSYHYSRLHTVLEEYQNVIFKPYDLPDEYDGQVYYTLHRLSCSNCYEELETPYIEGPSGGMFGL